jgi:hypothetical protein
MTHHVPMWSYVSGGRAAILLRVCARLRSLNPRTHTTTNGDEQTKAR